MYVTAASAALTFRQLESNCNDVEASSAARGAEEERQGEEHESDDGEGEESRGGAQEDREELVSKSGTIFSFVLKWNNLFVRDNDRDFYPMEISPKK